MNNPVFRVRALLGELRRRHVVQVAIVYCAAAFALLQGMDIVLPVLGVPEWVFRLVVITAVLGFPVALVLAWVYDLTPQGIVKVDGSGDGVEDPVHPRVGRAAGAGLLLLSITMVVGVVWLSFRWAVSGAEALAPLDPRAVAVLPFEDLNRSDSTSFFAAGMHDDIINHLTRIQELTVISRTSVIPYANSDLSIPEIARELGAGTILEGSVRSAGNRIRVVAQLIDARTDTHLWSESFDRELSDVFALQTEIAEQIARALEAELSDEERERIERAPTDNLVAYSAYLQGRIFSDRRDERDQAVQAVAAFEEAVDLDPGFAVAWAALARARMWLFWSWPGFGAEAARAADAVERAVQLAPDAAETRLAAGYLEFYGQGDPDRALRGFMDVQRLRPSDGEAATAVGLVLRRRGAWDGAVASLNRALEVDPRSYALSVALGQLHARMRQPDEAAAFLHQAVTLGPDLPAGRAGLIDLALSVQGDTVAAREAFEASVPYLEAAAQAGPAARIALYRGDAAGAAALLGAVPGVVARERALYLHLAGDTAAGEAAEQVIAAATAVVDEVQENEGATQVQVLARAHADRGLAEAILGNRTRAVRDATMAVSLVPMTDDAWGGADHVLTLAMVYTLIGEQEAALDRIEELLRVPSPLTVHDLRLNPLWGHLRDNPRMDDLLFPG